MTTITAEDVQSWLESVADQHVRDPLITPTLLWGVTTLTIAPIFDPPLETRSAAALGQPAPVAVATEFRCTWFGLRFSTRRSWPRPGERF